MGRRAKAAAEKALTGASRRPDRRAGTSKADAKPRRAQPPSWLVGPSARAQWNRIVPELQRLNLYNESLRDPVGRYCVHFADWVRLTGEIRKVGHTVMVETTHSTAEHRRFMPRVNPSLRARDTIERALIDLEDRFGFSPLARYRLTAFQAAHPRTDLFGHAAAKPQPDEAVGASMPPSSEPASPIGGLRTLN